MTSHLVPNVSFSGYKFSRTLSYQISPRPIRAHAKRGHFGGSSFSAWGHPLPLTDTACRAAKTREKAYKLADSKGLHLYVTPGFEIVALEIPNRGAGEDAHVRQLSRAEADGSSRHARRRAASSPAGARPLAGSAAGKGSSSSGSGRDIRDDRPALRCYSLAARQGRAASIRCLDQMSAPVSLQG